MDFATLTAVKEWLSIGVNSNSDDLLLSRLIKQMSAAILEYVQRPDFILTSYTELQNGYGNQRMMLRNWPVISVQSLISGSQTIPAANGINQSGYTLEQWDGTSSGIPQTITLNGYSFVRGWNNTQIIYKAGYCIQNERQTVFESGTSPNLFYSCIARQPLGMWAQDDGVTYTNGTALTPVLSNPLAGQYTVDGGIYGFNSADNGESLLISYSYIPSPITEACIEWVAERYRYRSRIGETGKTLSGAQTASYSLTLPDHIQLMLDPYKKYLPL